MISPEPLQSGPHLSAGKVTAYLAGSLDTAGRAEVEAHLAECEECRTEIIEVARLAREGKRFPWHVVIPLAAAAGVVGILLLDPSRSRTAADGHPVVRSPDTPDSVAGVAVVTPGPGATLHTGFELTWHQVQDASVYRVTVSDERGDSVWAGSTPDTTLVLPSGTIVRSNRLYFWYVDALLKDGRSVSSGLQEFRTGP
jgi:hypothetical protein